MVVSICLGPFLVCCEFPSSASFLFVLICPDLYLGCCDLPWTYASWVLRSALDLYSIVVLICAALFCVLVFRRDPISPVLFSFR